MSAPVDVRANLRMALQHILICCPDETVQKAIEDADDVVAELISARDEDATMPTYVDLNWIRDGNGEHGSKWWPRRRQELVDQGYIMIGEGSNGAEFFIRQGMTDRLAAALASCGATK